MAKSDSEQNDELKQRRKAPLITPTDLGAKASKDIAGGMNAILADVFALYLKTNCGKCARSAMGIATSPQPA